MAVGISCGAVALAEYLDLPCRVFFWWRRGGERFQGSKPNRQLIDLVKHLEERSSVKLKSHTCAFGSISFVRFRVCQACELFPRLRPR